MKGKSAKASGQLGFGLFLMGLGLVFLLSEFDLVELGSIWRLWPLGLIVPGLGMILSAHKRQTGMGVVMILEGLWFLAVQYRWLGLTWRNSWALLVVMIGIGMVVDSLTGRPRRLAEEREETSNV